MARITTVVKCWEVKKGTVVVVIPKKIRDQLKLKAGTKFHVIFNSKNQLIFQILENKK
ncbi:Hypothetical protein Nlim_1729 [Candidatus Nitrosarchaeum limnium SFB1]|jgi:AbrB family looped-hinge helix DNA binding protein|uniref:SpoVT-AbrB domain-containing protein n=1 Tax=Candidatus Nitrosarchaeum limnium SFB1 TaxID=886738 RepID=F3KMH9_9ARCH|nr:Hypothetical protein Nlim_1729 [Candidatus Nitrosarchaeum limnium SFB1]